MRNRSFLAVGSYPRSDNIMLLNMTRTVQRLRERSPEKAFKLVEENTYSVISFDDTDASRASGIEFLKKCRKVSPFSSRILYGLPQQKDELIALVEKGEITSYDIKPFDADLTLSANMLALESYKMNLVGSRLSALNFESITGVEAALTELNKIADDTGLGVEPPHHRGGGDLPPELWTHREAETSWVMAGVEAIKQTIFSAKASQNLLLEKTSSAWNAENLNPKISQAHEYFDRIDTFLSDTENFLKKSISHVNKTDIHIASVGEKIKQLKEDWLYL